MECDNTLVYENSTFELWMLKGREEWAILSKQNETVIAIFPIRNWWQTTIVKFLNEVLY